MNQESVTKSLTAPLYVIFTFMHLGFHVFEMAGDDSDNRDNSDGRGQNGSFYREVLNYSFIAVNGSGYAVHVMSGNMSFIVIL